MPQGIKPAPPQQSKLEEMWGKKKKPVKKEEEEEDVEMDDESVGTIRVRVVQHRVKLTVNSGELEEKAVARYVSRLVLPMSPSHA